MTKTHAVFTLAAVSMLAVAYGAWPHSSVVLEGDRCFGGGNRMDFLGRVSACESAECTRLLGEIEVRDIASLSRNENVVPGLARAHPAVWAWRDFLDPCTALDGFPGLPIRVTLDQGESEVFVDAFFIRDSLSIGYVQIATAGYAEADRRLELDATTLVRQAFPGLLVVDSEGRRWLSLLSSAGELGMFILAMIGGVATLRCRFKTLLRSGTLPATAKRTWFSGFRAHDPRTTPDGQSCCVGALPPRIATSPSWKLGL